MNDITKNELGTNELYIVMNHVDRSFSDICSGCSGIAYLGEIIPFDDAAFFADVTIRNNVEHSFQDCLERITGVKYLDLFDMSRKSVGDLQASLPDAAVEEIFRHAREAMAHLRATSLAFAACIKERSLKINFPDGDDLSSENFVESWHTLCADYSSLRHLKADLRDGAWLSQEEELRPWKELEQMVVDAILGMRRCFDWDELAFQRLEGRPLISWPLGTIDEDLLKEAKTLLAQAGSMWDLLRSELFRRVDEHFEFYLASGDESDYGDGEPDVEAESGFRGLSTHTV